MSATRHIGLDLGGTNIKWAVVERSGRRLAHARPRPGADRHLAPGRQGRGPAGRPRRRGARRRDRWCGRQPGRCRARSLHPRDRRGHLPDQRARRLVGDPGRRAAGGGDWPAHRAHQRRPRLRSRRAALRRGTRRGVVHRLHPRHRRRRRRGHRQPGHPGLPRTGRRAGPPDHRPRRSVVRLRQSRLRGGLLPGRPGGHRVRDQRSARGHREGPRRRRAGHRRTGRDRPLPGHRHQQRRHRHHARAGHPRRRLVQRR